MVNCIYGRLDLPCSRSILVIFLDPETRRSYTYGQVRNTAIEFGKGLKSVWEWQKGDVLALFTPNSIDTPSVLWGCHWAGGIICPANPAYTVDELVFQLKDSGAKALVTQKALLPRATKAAKQVGIPEDRIILIGNDRDKSMRFKHFQSVRNLAGTSRYRRTKANPREDLAFLAYSSGTTGHPKGVMLSHGNVASNLVMAKAGGGDNVSWQGGPDGQGDKLLAFLPFYHIYGMPARNRIHLKPPLIMDHRTRMPRPRSHVSWPNPRCNG